MKRNPITPPTVKTEVFLLDGGINENVSSLEMKPGELISCKNYYVTEGSTGGYVSLKGYERFDGQAKPSEATYKILTTDITGTVAPGDTIEGAPKSWYWDFLVPAPEWYRKSTSGSVSTASGRLTLSLSLSQSGVTAATQLDGLIAGDIYQVTFDTGYTAQAYTRFAIYDLATSSYTITYTTAASIGSYSTASFSFKAPSTAVLLEFVLNKTSGNVVASTNIDNISVERKDTILDNGEFTYNTKWTLGTGWSISSGKLNAVAGYSSAAEPSPAIAAVSAKDYSYSFTVTRTAGSATISFGGDSTAAISSSGTYTGTFTTINTDGLVITKDAAFVGTIDGFELQLDPSPHINPTATVVSEEEGYLIITDDTAAFGSSNLEISGTVVGTCTGPQTSGSAALAPYAKGIVSDYYRSLITDVPGQGPIRGLHVYNGKVYVFRDAVGGTTGAMFVESSTGWDEIDTSGLPLEPGGVYSFINYNFSGASFTESMFWTNGVDKAAYFDGSTVTQITTGMTTDTPVYLAAHGDRLWLSFAGGSLQYSNVGDPTDWSTGAGEIGVGYEITGLVGSVGDTLLVFGDSHIKVLEGSDVSTWVFKFFSDSVGAYPRTICKLFDTVIFASHMGITTLSAAQEFGDFASNSISEKVKRTLFAYRDLITCATVVRSLNQYRIFFSNGKGLIFSFYNKKLRGATVCEYIDPVYIVTEGERTDTTPVNYFAGITNYVYQMDSGTSFDGEEIVSNFSIPYFHYNSPRMLKRFLRSTFEITSLDPKTFYIKPNFDYNMTPYPKGLKEEIAVTSAGAVWGEGLWGTMMWSGTDITNRVFYDFLGIGGNMSITISSSSSMTRQHTFQNLIVDYIILGRQM